MAVFAAMTRPTMVAASTTFLIQRFILMTSNQMPPLRNSKIPSARAPNGDGVVAQGGLAAADRDALAVLAAGADAVVELEIVADHRYAAQVSGAVADQHGALDRRAAFAVLEPIGFGALEHVFARG